MEQIMCQHTFMACACSLPLWQRLHREGCHRAIWESSSALHEHAQLQLFPQAESATVLRNGNMCLVASGDLVPGDIVEVAVGAKVPADMRVVQLLSSVVRIDQVRVPSVPQPAMSACVLRVPAASTQDHVHTHEPAALV